MRVPQPVSERVGRESERENVDGNKRITLVRFSGFVLFHSAKFNDVITSHFEKWKFLCLLPQALTYTRFTSYNFCDVFSMKGCLNVIYVCTYVCIFI
jgi:hypothetical protein